MSRMEMSLSHRPMHRRMVLVSVLSAPGVRAAVGDEADGIEQPPLTAMLRLRTNREPSGRNGRNAASVTIVPNAVNAAIAMTEAIAATAGGAEAGADVTAIAGRHR